VTVPNARRFRLSRTPGLPALHREVLADDIATENRSVGGSIPPLGTTGTSFKLLSFLANCTVRKSG
jgi:hypothetical protein